jgi:hypothetical protein
MIKKIIKNRYFAPLIISLLISLPAVFRLIRPGFYFMYDDMQVIRLQQMDKCIKDGQIPCRWVPDLGYGYGYPLYEYYSPLPYYFMEIFHLSGLEYIDSVKLGFILSVFFSALFIYLLAKRFFSETATLAVTFLYVLAPFRATGLFVRGAMGEAWGMAALPLLLLGFENLLRKKDRTSLVLFSLTVFVFLTTHNLTILLSLPIITGWILIRILQMKSKKEVMKKLIISSSLGLLMSAFFIVPLVFERNLVHLETLTQGYFYYVSHFLSIKQLIFSLHWGYGPSVVGPNDDQFLGVGPIHTAVALLAFALLMIKKFKNKYSVLLIFLFLSFWGGLFMAHSRSSFIWENLTFMKYFQFPWRWVFVSTFAASFLGGAIFEFSGRTNNIILTVLIIALILVYGNLFKPSQWRNLTDEQKLSGAFYQSQVTASIYDYLPKSASKAPDEAAPKTLIVNNGEVLIKSSEKGSDWFKYSVEVGDKGASVSIPAYDFPVWKVSVDDKEVQSNPEGKLGLTTFSLNSGGHTIFARLTKSVPRIIGDYLTLVGIASGAFIYAYAKKAENK